MSDFAKMSVLCPGGIRSQTGVAVGERYPAVSIEGFSGIDGARKMLVDNDGPFVVPIWNSHQGEVTAADYIWNDLQDSKLKLTDIWPKTIEFWYVRRTGVPKKFGKIGSVIVAGTQCSAFLASEEAKLVEKNLTTTALDEFKAGAEWDGVLVAPGQGENEEGLEVVIKATANPNNFTSFVRFVPPRMYSPVGANSWLTGISMPALRETLGDDQQSMFEQMFIRTQNLEDAPKLIFVLRRNAKVGMLFEGKPLLESDLLDAEEAESGQISVYEDVGATSGAYTEELRDLFDRKFPDLIRSDFTVHRGVNTCLFACPALGLYTHGYEAEAVEPVVRFYISRLFENWYNRGMKCTSAQTHFFEKYEESWIDQGSKFIEFSVVSAEGVG